MILVTVGTHEQQFNRLVKKVDELKASGIITEDVFMQVGFSTYVPEHCQWCQMMPYDKLQHMIKEARIVITHGGPSSFIAPLQMGKIPIVVPRHHELGEHVNNHQVAFCKQIAEEGSNIILVDDIELLGMTIENYDGFVSNPDNQISSNNKTFVREFKLIVNELMGEK